MTRPTKEQIAEARVYIAASLEAFVFTKRTSGHIRTLLAATEEPSEEELLLEAARAANDHLEYVGRPQDVVDAKRAMAGENEGVPWYDAVRLYIAGARREGHSGPAVTSEEPTASPTNGGRFDRLFELVVQPGDDAAQIAGRLTVESFGYPHGFAADVAAYRKLRTDARVSAARSFLARREGRR